MVSQWPNEKRQGRPLRALLISMCLDDQGQVHGADGDANIRKQEHRVEASEGEWRAVGTTSFIRVTHGHGPMMLKLCDWPGKVVGKDGRGDTACHVESRKKSSMKFAR